MTELLEQASLSSSDAEVPHLTQGFGSCSNVFQPTDTAVEMVSEYIKSYI